MHWKRKKGGGRGGGEGERERTNRLVKTLTSSLVCVGVDEVFLVNESSCGFRSDGDRM